MDRLTQMVLSYQQGMQDAASLIERFQPLLRHYAGLLSLEDGFEELRLSLIEILLKLPAADFPSENPDWAVLSYVKRSIYHRYIALSKESQLHRNRTAPYQEALQSAQQTPDQLFVRRLVNRLPERQQQVILLEFYLGFRESEIAQMLGISRQAVNQLKKRALHSLRRWMQD